MENKTDKINEENRRTGETGAKSDIGAGRKIGIYGCALIILAVLLVLVYLFLTGIYNPLPFREGAGP